MVKYCVGKSGKKYEVIESKGIKSLQIGNDLYKIEGCIDAEKYHITNTNGSLYYKNRRKVTLKDLQKRIHFGVYKDYNLILIRESKDKNSYYLTERIIKKEETNEVKQEGSPIDVLFEETIGSGIEERLDQD